MERVVKHFALWAVRRNHELSKLNNHHKNGVSKFGHTWPYGKCVNLPY